MTIDQAQVRQRALKNLLTSPSVVFPEVIGAGSLLVGLLLGNPTGLWGIIGIAGIALGLGVASLRWFGRSGQLEQAAREQLEKGLEREHRSYLRQLQRRLRKDDDPRTNEILKQLKELRPRLVRAGVIGRRKGPDLVAEIRDDARTLYRSAIASLERTLQHHRAADEMTTSKPREELIGELQEGVAHLGTTLDYLQATALDSGQHSEELERMQAELQRGLQVAKRVEDRMDRLDQDFNVGGRDAAT